MNHRLLILTLLATITLVGACAAAGASASSRRSDCDLRAQDSVYALAGPVFRDCSVDTKARPTAADAHPDFRPTSPGNVCYSADVEYVVSTRGEVEQSTGRIVRASNDAYAQSVVNMLPRLKFEPAIRNGIPVRQIVADHHSMATAVVKVAAGAPVTPPPRGSVQTKC